MASSDDRVQTWLIDLSAATCADRLEASALGRVGTIVDGRPQIFPVNHVYDRASGRIVFPTQAGTRLHAALQWPWIAFEIDGMDPDGAGGWSVVVVGQGEPLTDEATIARARRARRVLWAAGPGTEWAQIVPVRVTGRRISAVVR
jgi:nitroimidazol reductase NimA-like FMN-containing flavoprotein (pyridoxamine 5'-phosphate oxidase superfamily)